MLQIIFKVILVSFPWMYLLSNALCKFTKSTCFDIQLFSILITCPGHNNWELRIMATTQVVSTLFRTSWLLMKFLPTDMHSYALLSRGIFNEIVLLLRLLVCKVQVLYSYRSEARTVALLTFTFVDR